ncbi:MAG TPA: apolipoprotein N-acyltransferase [Trebonia sp.]|nr:apolipoprotein N-acyltransferase [Trebonia sp.]
MIPAQTTSDQAAPPIAVAPAPPRIRWALLIALAGGLLLAAAFPPVGVWPLAAAGPALLLVALSGRSLRASFAVGLVFGVAFFFPLLVWVTNVAWYAWIALAIASTVIFGVLTVGQRLLLRLPGWPLGVAGWWVAAEAVRDRWPWGGFPWGRLGMSQAGAPTQGWAAIGGAPLLSFMVALVGAMLGWLVLTAWPGRLPRGRTTLAAVAMVATAALAAVPALLPLDPVAAGTPTTEVAAIQGDVPRARSLATQLNDWMVTLNHVSATQALARAVAAGKKPAPDVVIWPENSTDIDPSLYPPVYNQIAAASAAIKTPILVGAVLENPVRNASVLWLPGKGPVATYVKQKLVPFGEYIPLRSVISKITSLTALQPVNFTAGDKTVVFTVGKIRLSAMICWEVGFDSIARSEVTAGANLLTMPSNDATYEREGETTGESGQQLAMARIRAVEHDRSVVVASTTGYSAIIAPGGRLITRSGLWQQAELEARVPLVTHITLADRVGPWPEYGIVAATGLGIVLAIALSWRRRLISAGPVSSSPGAEGDKH